MKIFDSIRNSCCKQYSILEDTKIVNTGVTIAYLGMNHHLGFERNNTLINLDITYDSHFRSHTLGIQKIK